MADAARLLNDYCSALASAFSLQDGVSLARLISLSGSEGYRRAVAESLDAGKDPKKLARKLQTWGLEDMLQSHLLCMQAYYHHRYAEAFAELQNSTNVFLQEFRNWDSTWAMKALHAMVFDIRAVAEKADMNLAAGVRPREHLKTAGSFLMKVFGAIAGKGPKRMGALYVACQLFKVYFKLGTVHLCRSIIRVIDAGNFDDYPACDKVTYKYYTGRLDVYNDEFNLADEKLTYALQHCHSAKTGNMRRILRYLVPVRLSLGSVPSEQLLDKYGLPEV